ncbi:hypothetical protein TNIN_94991 [Trichonephila inaurata madagascariensis]|uniref:Uncharacterized protein n=1 Tax=Trichonephila inaurata madagascariensis TaxID=2747483 RepID=A0A8X6WXW2_9ARAC|nr:hypothetical protein TNIN_94991 [Trichonephila inaurata madagascariensis]
MGTGGRDNLKLAFTGQMFYVHITTPPNDAGTVYLVHQRCVSARNAKSVWCRVIGWIRRIRRGWSTNMVSPDGFRSTRSGVKREETHGIFLLMNS